MQSAISEAIVVRVVDYGEADRVATLLLRDVGKVAALARGARRSRKRFAALTLFARGEAHVKEGRGELWAMESFDVRRGYPRIGLDVTKVAHGAYACELARELLPAHHPEPRAYQLLADLLTLLDEGPPPAGAAHLRIFELALLDALGFAPALDRCVACDRDLATEAEDEGGDQLDVRSGGVICGRCAGPAPGRRPLPARVRRLLLRAQRASLVEPASLFDGASADPARARETWDGARDALQAILHEHLGRPLRSLEFINKLNSNHLAARS